MKKGELLLKKLNLIEDAAIRCFQDGSIGMSYIWRSLQGKLQDKLDNLSIEEFNNPVNEEPVIPNEILMRSSRPNLEIYFHETGADV